MSSERPFGDSGTEHHAEPDHPRPIEEATAAVPTPNRFWRMMADPGFPSPASNPASFMVTTEAFLDLTSQVQALAGMVQTIIPYLLQLVHSMAHQSAPPNPLQSADQDGLLLGQVWGGIANRVSRLIEPEPPNRTTNIKVAGLPTFVTGRCPADSKTDSGGKIVIAPTLAEAKTRHEQVPSRDNP
ncbi:hypothetical protein B296_00051305, partial [Ensete ventricosum]